MHFTHVESFKPSGCTSYMYIVPIVCLPLATYWMLHSDYKTVHVLAIIVQETTARMADVYRDFYND